MNWLDLIVIVLALASAYRGWRLGFLGQAFELGGGFLGLIVGLALGPQIASAFTDRAGLTAALISLIVLFVALSLGQTAGYIVGHRLGLVVTRARLGLLNSATGALFGITIILLGAWLLSSVLVHGPSRGIARAIKQSDLLVAVNRALPRPPDIVGQLQQYLNTSGFPQVFAGLPRSIGPPVRLPSERTARRAVAAADQSTVRVVVPACGGTQLGSGWIAADSTVVTNAHVVAGGEEITIQEQGSGDHAGAVVLFDPRTDIAIVHVEGLTAPALELTTVDQERGTPGATLGYPGAEDGDLVPQAAAVQAMYDAVGRDIYGNGEVERELYELRSRVRQGDSGGPFVLPNGFVAGVVFAASTTDSDTGYALTGAEVSDEIDRGSRRTSQVSTGDCTR
ncbi:MAG: MarP family serine protease [Actinomycetota bacterium]